MPSLIWVSRETDIKNRFRSHIWLLFQVSLFFFVSSPASIHGPGQQSCTNVSIIPVLSGKLSLHARFLLELRCLHICHICFHPFCFSSTLHSFLPSFSPCPSFTLSLQSFSVSLSRLQNLKQKWVRAFRLVT